MQTDILQAATSPMATMTRQAHSLIASDRVEGTPVRRSDGTKVGTIERLMIDKHSGSVAYAVLNFGGFLGLGHHHLPIPWARLTYDRTLGGYQLDLSDDELSRAPAFEANKDFDWRPQPRGRRSQLLQGAAVLGRVLGVSAVLGDQRAISAKRPRKITFQRLPVR
jgi:hypothetical protein